MSRVIRVALLMMALLSAGFATAQPAAPAPAPAWHTQLCNSGGGYWRGRIPVDVENPSAIPLANVPVQVPVGSDALAGESVRALRVVDDKGQELVFECLDAAGRLKHEGNLAPGDTLFLPVQCDAHGRTRLFIHLDNPQASPVDDFLPIPGRIENGGLETGTTAPMGWTQRLADDHRKLAWVFDSPHSGQKCVRVEVDKGQEPNWVQWGQASIPVVPGQEYAFRAWVRAEGVTGKAGWYVHVNGAKPQLINKVLDAGSGSFGWKELTFQFRAPEEATDATVGTVLYGDGAAWYDDASLQATGKPPSQIVRVGPKERMDLAEPPAAAKWYSEPGAPEDSWQYRLPVVIRNLSDKAASNQVVLVEPAAALKSLLRKVNLRSLRVVEPSPAGDRVLPALRMDKSVAFLADVPAQTACTYYLYLSRNPNVPQSGQLSYAGLVASPANRLTNPDFEQGEEARGWTHGSEGDAGSAQCRYSLDKPGHTGQSCAKLDVPPGAPLRWSGWRQMVSAEPNSLYFYSGFLKTKDVEGGGVCLHIHILDAERKLVKGQWGASTRPSVTGTSDWTQSTGFIKTPGDAHFLEAHLTSNVHGTVWHDSIILCRTLPAVAQGVQERTVASQPSCALWQVNPLVKVFRGDAPEPFSGGIRVQLARNEYEPAQLVVKTNRDVKGVTAKIIVPKNGGAALDAALNVVGYVPVDYPTNYYSSRLGPGYRLFPSAPPRSDGWAGDWPDPLRPNAPFDLSANAAQPLWITVHAAENTQAGDYRGKLVLDLPGLGTKEVPLEVTVWDFSLTKASKLRVIFDLSVGSIRKYDTRPDEKAVLRDWYKSMADHRVCPDHIRPEPKIAFKDRQVEFDAADFDDMARYCLDDLAMNSFYAPGCFYTLGWAYPPRKVWNLEPFSPEYNEAIPKTLDAFMTHLREKGWDKKVIVYVSDEPHYRQPGVVDNLAKYCALVHKVLGARTYSSTWDYVPGLVGAIDIWGVGVHGSFPVERMKERLAAGDGLLFTTDGHMCIDTPYLAVERLLPYFCWKYDVSGYEFWGLSWWTYNPWERGWHKFISQTDSPDKPRYHVRYPNGDGYLTYPGQTVGVVGPVSSIRFEQVREGIEDYEYFSILKGLIADAKKQGIATDTAEQALELACSLVSIPNPGGLRSTDLMPDPDAIPATRAAVAREIVTLRSMCSAR